MRVGEAVVGRGGVGPVDELVEEGRWRGLRGAGCCSCRGYALEFVVETCKTVTVTVGCAGVEEARGWLNGVGAGGG